MKLLRKRRVLTVYAYRNPAFWSKYQYVLKFTIMKVCGNPGFIRPFVQVGASRSFYKPCF